MPKLIVVSQAGTSRPIEASADLSLMEAIRDNGFDELLALCGGSCSCATCHVYVQREYLTRLPLMTDEEKDLIEGSSVAQPSSRLSCQIRIEQELDGMIVTIAPADAES